MSVTIGGQYSNGGITACIGKPGGSTVTCQTELKLDPLAIVSDSLLSWPACMDTQVTSHEF